MLALATFIYLTWAAFWIYWIFKAAGTRRNQPVTGRAVVFRLVILILIFLFFRRILSGGGNFNERVHVLALEVIGTILFVVGLALAIWARLNLANNWGAPMARKVKPELITSGPYSYVRHPIYTGVLFANLGTALAVSYSWFLILVIAGSYFIYSAFKEEEYMTSQFGESYVAYKKTTKMLIPFIF